MPKIVYNEAERAAIVDEFRTTKLSQKDFCAKYNISTGSLYIWRQRFDPHSVKTIKQFPVQAKPTVVMPRGKARVVMTEAEKDELAIDRLLLENIQLRSQLRRAA